MLSNKYEVMYLYPEHGELQSHIQLVVNGHIQLVRCTQVYDKHGVGKKSKVDELGDLCLDNGCDGGRPIQDKFNPTHLQWLQSPRAIIVTAMDNMEGRREVWDAFTKAYPEKWAVQCFPPESELVDSKAVYHLWVLEEEPEGLNLR